MSQEPDDLPKEDVQLPEQPPRAAQLLGLWLIIAGGWKTVEVLCFFAKGFILAFTG